MAHFRFEAAQSIALSLGYSILTKEEWDYTIKNSSIGFATVNEIPGLVILPDNWETPSGCSFSASTDSYSANIYYTTQWLAMEERGAVFLPAAGYYYSSVKKVGQAGAYSSSTPYNIGTTVYFLYFLNDGSTTTLLVRYGFVASVRLVKYN